MRPAARCPEARSAATARRIVSAVSTSAAAEPRLAARTLLAGRYRLERLLGDLGPAHCWRARDEVLARPVGVRVLESPTRAAAKAFLDAAGLAGRVSHPGLVNTFDAAREDLEGIGSVCYDVVEWVDGPTLADLLAEGPLAPRRATTVARALAEALVGLHRARVRHGAVHPGAVVLGTAGPVKVTGAVVAAVLAGPGLDDTVGLAATLYAALTGRWPFGTAYGLPAAPLTDRGVVCAPRQVRAGVSRELDSVVIRALDPSRLPTLAPITDPRAFADALADLPCEPLDPEAAPVPQPRARRQLPRWARRLIAVGVLALIGILGYALGLAVAHVPTTRAGAPPAALHALRCSGAAGTPLATGRPCPVGQLSGTPGRAGDR